VWQYGPKSKESWYMMSPFGMCFLTYFTIFGIMYPLNIERGGATTMLGVLATDARTCVNDQLVELWLMCRVVPDYYRVAHSLSVFDTFPAWSKIYLDWSKGQHHAFCFASVGPRANVYPPTGSAIGRSRQRGRF